jgi:hypothetical protein
LASEYRMDLPRLDAGSLLRRLWNFPLLQELGQNLSPVPTAGTAMSHCHIWLFILCML